MTKYKRLQCLFKGHDDKKIPGGSYWVLKCERGEFHRMYGTFCYRCFRFKLNAFYPLLEAIDPKENRRGGKK